jgi:superfamily II DNA or RNA helicase
VHLPETIADYMRSYAPEWSDRILELHPPLYTVDDPPSPMIGKLLRKPYPAQTLAIMDLVRRWQQARAGAVIAECGTGKTLISLGAVQTHAEDRPFTALAMVPPQLVEKWCREAILIRPGKSATHQLGHRVAGFQRGRVFFVPNPA